MALRFYVDVLLVNDPAVSALAKELGVPRAHAYGCVVALRSWAVEHAEGGQLPDLDETIAEAGLWRGEPDDFVKALRPAFIDAKRRMVGWHDFAGTLLARRIHDRLRKGSGGSSSGNSSGNSSGASTTEVRRKKKIKKDLSSASPQSLDPAPAFDLSLPQDSKGFALTDAFESKATTNALEVAPVSWSREACDDWKEFTHGTAPGGKIGRALKPLVEAQGWFAVRKAWRRYLSATRLLYASPTRFAETYGEWAGTVLPPPPPDRSHDSVVIGLERSGVTEEKFQHYIDMAWPERKGAN